MRGHFKPHTETAIKRIADAVNMHHDAQGFRANNGQKRCRGCDQLLPVSEYSIHRRKKDGLRCNCKKCDSIKFSDFYLKNHERQKARAIATSKKRREQGLAQAYEAKNKERLTRIRREWAQSHPEKINARNKRMVETLTDSYIANNLKIPIRLIPPELIEAKRTHLQLVRITKQLVTAIKEKQNGTK